LKSDQQTRPSLLCVRYDNSGGTEEKKRVFVLAVREKLELTLSSWRAVVKLKLEQIMRPQEITRQNNIFGFFSFFL